MALGFLGYNYDEFLDLTPRSLSNAMRGYNKKTEAAAKERWEVMRLQTSALINIQLPKNSRVSPDQLFRFPWDYKTNTPKLTSEEAKAILKKWREH